MAESERKLWTRDETVSALSLYCQLPFGKFHQGNAEVKQLALQLDRTPAAIALKLVNLASLDPEHHARGVRGMTHVSRLDREVWEEYYGKWETLADAFELEEDQPDTSDAPEMETDALSLRLSRRGQGFFRRSVLAAYGTRCCITGIDVPDLLRASHIVPWSHDPAHRLDPRNGLAMNALHDVAFDRGFITIDESYRICISPTLAHTMDEPAHTQFFDKYAGRKIFLPERFAPLEAHLLYHRESIFRN